MRAASYKFRLLGFVPICFFLSHLYYHLLMGTPQHLLWMCNFSNLLLAAGLLFNFPALIRIAVVWQIPGLPLWVIDMIHTGDMPYSTFLSHIGGLTVGLTALYRVRMTGKIWPLALGYGLLLQLICRLFTPPELNVNIAFDMYYGWHGVFDSYWKYWLFTAVMAAMALFLLEQILARIFPPNRKGQEIPVQRSTQWVVRR